MEIPVGIVLYNPKIERLRENLAAVCAQAPEIIVVDNASENAAEITSLLSGYHSVEYLRNGRNLGIAKALNQICAAARERNYAFVVTLDQDSACPENMFAEYRKYAGLGRLGILCPQVRDRNGGRLVQHRADTGHCIRRYLRSAPREPCAGADGGVSIVDRCITSASMVSLEAWEAACGFDESMFIDGVDHDFCDRIARKGYLVYRVNSVTLLHEIGSIEVRRFFAWKVLVKNHPAFRKYYIARNTVFLARKRRAAGLVQHCANNGGYSTRYLRDAVLAFKPYLQVTKQFLTVLFYEGSKKEKLGAILRGASDGRKLGIDKRWEC